MTKDIHAHRILILDFGSQYTQLIARRVREIGVYCELWAWDVTEEQIREAEKDSLKTSPLTPGNAMTPAEKAAVVTRMAPTASCRCALAVSRAASSAACWFASTCAGASAYTSHCCTPSTGATSRTACVSGS